MVRDVLSSLMELYTLRLIREFGFSCWHTSGRISVDPLALEEAVYSSAKSLRIRVVAGDPNLRSDIEEKLSRVLRYSVGVRGETISLPDLLVVAPNRKRFFVEVKTTVFEPAVPLHQSVRFRGFQRLYGRVYFLVYNVDIERKRVSGGLYTLGDEAEVVPVLVPKHQIRGSERALLDRNLDSYRYLIRSRGRIYSLKERLRSLDVDSLPQPERGLFKHIFWSLEEDNKSNLWGLLNQKFGLLRWVRSRGG